MKLEERYAQNTTLFEGRRGGGGGLGEEEEGVREGLTRFGMEQDVFLFMIF